MAQGVFAITEQRDGAFRKVSYEVVSEGRRIADGMGSELTAAVRGSGVEGIAAELEKYGPEKIVVADDAALAEYTTDAYTNVLADLIKAADPAGLVAGVRGWIWCLATRFSRSRRGIWESRHDHRTTDLALRPDRAVVGRAARQG